LEGRCHVHLTPMPELEKAGPCGYGLHRLLTGYAHECVVVAPSLIPIKAGDRVKTDRRDALMLAKLHRAGELTAIWIPDAAHEAMRDLVRARATAVRVLVNARQRAMSGFTAGLAPGPCPIDAGCRRCTSSISAQQIVPQDYIHAVQEAETRHHRLTQQIEEL